MTTFKISKFVARYDLEPIYSVDSSEKLHYVIDIYQRENCFFPITRRGSVAKITQDVKRIYSGRA
jgi:hypothetical protein